jgi:hypothetical protein
MADNEQHRNDSPPRPLGQPTTVETMMVCVVNNYTVVVVVVVVDNLRLPRVVKHLLSA